MVRWIAVFLSPHPQRTRPWPEGILQPLRRSYHPPTSRSMAKLPCRQWCTLWWNKGQQTWLFTGDAWTAASKSISYVSTVPKKLPLISSSINLQMESVLPEKNSHKISFRVKILISTNVLFVTLSQMFVQDIQQSLGFHRVAIDGIFNPESCIHHGPTLKGTPEN